MKRRPKFQFGYQLAGGVKNLPPSVQKDIKQLKKIAKQTKAIGKKLAKRTKWKPSKRKKYAKQTKTIKAAGKTAKKRLRTAIRTIPL